MTAFKEGSKPARQGTYEVRLEDATETVALWLEHEGRKAWLHYPAGRPDAERKTAVELQGVVAYRTASKESIAVLERAQQTEADRIEAVYRSYIGTNTAVRELYTAPVPPRRQLQVGDCVEMGALKDAVVIELRRDGQDVICSYRDAGLRYGQPYDNGIAYRAVHWTDIVPLKNNKNTHMVRRPLISDAYRTVQLSSLLYKVRRGVNAHPDYQRGYVWTDKDKHNYLESVFECRELGRFLFVSNEWPKEDDILDGKQRLNCLTEFFEGRIAYQGVYFDELSASDRQRIEGRSVQFAELPAAQLTRATLLEIFLQVNAAGVPQSEEHLEHVRKLLEHERSRVLSASEAVKMLERFPSHMKVAELYDDEEDLRSALATCFDGFEYPNFSHLAMREVVNKAHALHRRGA